MWVTSEVTPLSSRMVMSSPRLSASIDGTRKTNRPKQNPS
jgi:hypothetical protein